MSLAALMLLVLITALIDHFTFFQRASRLQPDYNREALQLGYFDMISKNRELYDAHFDAQDRAVMMTLTSPNDHRFIVRARLEQQRNQEGVNFNYRLIYNSEPTQDRMLTNNLGFMARNGVAFDRFEFRGEPVLVTPYGLIIRYR